MREIKLRVKVLRPLASGARGALPLVGGVCWGVTARKASHNASHARGVTAGKMGDATLIETIAFILHSRRCLKEAHGCITASETRD